MILRVDILEASTGVCLFEKIWKWSGVSRAEAICKLVLTFFKISRDIGDASGEISQVLFEQPTVRDRGQSTTGNKIHNIYIGSLKNKQSKENGPQIRLSCRKVDSVIIAVFHDPVDQMDGFLTKASKHFSKHYLKKVFELKPKILELGNTDKEFNQTLSKEVMDAFIDFLRKVDQLEKRYSVTFESSQEDTKGDKSEETTQTQITRS